MDLNEAIVEQRYSNLIARADARYAAGNDLVKAGRILEAKTAQLWKDNKVEGGNEKERAASIRTQLDQEYNAKQAAQDALDAAKHEEWVAEQEVKEMRDVLRLREHRIALDLIGMATHELARKAHTEAKSE